VGIAILDESAHSNLGTVLRLCCCGTDPFYNCLDGERCGYYYG
jgi:hypothetical protein